MKRKELTRQEVEEVFLEYAKLMNKLIGLDSTMNEKDRLQIIRSFKLGYQVAEHYYLHDLKVSETDSFFIFAENSLEALRRVAKQNTNKKKNPNKKKK